MTTTAHLRQQHAEIGQIMQQVEACLVAERLRTDPAPVRTLLGELLGKLKIHLAIEDNALYPRLKGHADKRLSETAARFMTEMAGLRPAVGEYAKRWQPESIRQDPQRFTGETRDLFTALRDRIRREDRELYPLADTL